MSEGNPTDNELQRRSLEMVTMDKTALHQFGDTIVASAASSGCGDLISKPIVFNKSALGAHHLLGVNAQCVYLVRPDHYVGLRSEPIREGVVYIIQVSQRGLLNCAESP